MKARKKTGFATFIKWFFIWLMIFMVVMIPGRMLFEKFGGIRIFSGEENLFEQMEPIVDPNSPFFETFNDSERVNVIVMGTHDELTDTIMLGSFDLKNQHVDIISIPRDTYFERPEANSPAARKINAVYRNGRAVGTATAVSQLLMGVPIHYYAVVTFDGVEKIVDSMGGVPMDIPFRMRYDDPTDKPPLRIDIPAGEQVLDGDHAVQFLRFRKSNSGKGYPDGDIGRVKAQQKFIKSAFKESLGLGFPKVAKTVLDNVDSDLTAGMALKIAAKAVGLDASSIETYTVPGEARTKKGTSYWIPDSVGIETMLYEIYSYSKEESEDGKMTQND
ncbi:MAG TPA: LCP family protein [Clostridiales bacterium]|jgi:LCP family protein required for cell wall assembly|nr:LCP family protein [Clostridiales bacterium]